MDTGLFSSYRGLLFKVHKIKLLKVFKKVTRAGSVFTRSGDHRAVSPAVRGRWGGGCAAWRGPAALPPALLLLPLGGANLFVE